MKGHSRFWGEVCLLSSRGSFHRLRNFVHTNHAVKNLSSISKTAFEIRFFSLPPLNANPKLIKWNIADF